LRDPPSSQHGVTTGQNDARSDRGVSSNLGAADSDASEAPDLSAEFQGEMAALRAHFAERIAAVRRGLHPADVAAVIKAILNEETIAMRALSDRWRAATMRQRAERPKRVTGAAQRKGVPKPP
jgi:hypothetical protein